MNKTDDLKHNGIISFWKFVFSIIIVVYHLNLTNYNKNMILSSGYIGVEFFFLVSGYLMAKNALKKNYMLSIGKGTFSFLLKKIKGFLPYMSVSFFITLLIKIIFNNYTIAQIANSLWNLFFLETSGINATLVVGQTWYISAMLISMLLLYPLVLKFKENFIYLIAPIIVLFLGGWISHNYGTLNGWEYTGFVYKCLLRGFFEISLGTILYEVSQNIKYVNFNQFGKILLTFIETLGFIGVLIIANSHNHKYDFIALLLMSISISLAFSEHTLFTQFANNNLFYYLEKISLPIYMNHYWIIILINNYFKQSYWVKLILTIILTFAFSMIIMFIIEKNKGEVLKVVKRTIIKT